MTKWDVTCTMAIKSSAVVCDTHFKQMDYISVNCLCIIYNLLLKTCVIFPWQGDSSLMPLQHQLMVFKYNAKALAAHVKRQTQQVSAARCLAFSWSCHNQSLALPAWCCPYSVWYCQMSLSWVGWQIRAQAQKSAQKGTRFIIKNWLPTLFFHTLSEWDL